MAIVFVIPFVRPISQQHIFISERTREGQSEARTSFGRGRQARRRSDHFFQSNVQEYNGHLKKEKVSFVNYKKKQEPECS